MTTPRRWTGSEDQTLQAMRRSGSTTHEIASALDRTADSVHHRARRLHAQGINPPRRRTGGRGRAWTRREDQALTDMHRAGWSLSEVAVELDRTHDAVASRVKQLRKLGVDLPRRRGPTHAWTQAEDRTLQAMSRSGRAPVEIAQALDRTELAVHHRAKTLRRLGVDLPRPTRPTLTPARQRQLERLAKNGQTPARIAQELGVPFDLVRSRVRALQAAGSAPHGARGATLTKTRWSTDMEQKLLAALKDGHTLSQAAQKTGVTHSAAENRLRKLRAQGRAPAPRRADWQALQPRLQKLLAQGRTIEQAARELDLTPGQVRGRVERALRHPQGKGGG